MTRDAPRRAQPREGAVVWLVGRPATGKTCVAQHLGPRLRAQGDAVLALDSDALRTVLTPEPTYRSEERDWFYGVLGHLAKLGAEGGAIAVVSATAPRRRYRDAVRQAVTSFFEVHLTCPEAELRARDPKGLYRRAALGEISNLPGLDAPFEAPEHPELAFDTSVTPATAIAEAIMVALENRRAAGAPVAAFDRYGA